MRTQRIYQLLIISDQHYYFPFFYYMKDTTIINEVTIKDKEIYNKHCADYGEFQHYILPAADNIIAIGDIHGDYKFALRLLVAAKVIQFDKKNNDIKWIGNKTIVVQIGDQIDRCRPYKSTCDDPQTTKNDEASDIAILLLFNDLHKKASQHGGAVISLLGNHELMNVMGNMNYVSYKGVMQFGNTYEQGLTKRKELFAVGNKYAKLLACTRVSYLIVGEFIFIHGGLVPKFIDSLDKNGNNFYETNYYVRQWLLGYLQDSQIKHIVRSNPDTIFWDRILGSIPPNVAIKNNEVCEKYLEKVLSTFNLSGMIIGHTPQIFKHNTGINGTCDDKLWRVDIGGSTAFLEFDEVDSEHRKPQVLRLYKDNGKYKSEVLFYDFEDDDMVEKLKRLGNR